MQASIHIFRTNRALTICLCLLTAMTLAAACTATRAQVLIGSTSSGAAWQTWSVTPISFDQPDLNDNGSPWWDLQWAAAGSYGNSTGADKNPGFCITSTGDCVGMASNAFAPGAIPFWGINYDAVNDTGGTRDNTVYFRSFGATLRATLYLNATANPNEVNDFGWFETNSTGTSIGRRHKLFGGTGINKNLIPTPIGTTISFTPTRYFGFYYSDISEPACPDGSDPYITDVQCNNASLPLHGCYANTLFLLNDAKCTETGGGQGDHDFVIFSANAQTSSSPVFWVVGEDPSDCQNEDGDCNQTIVRISH